MRKHQSWMLAAGLLAAIILPNWAQAASYTVTQTLDNDTDVVDSLSWAINQANGTTEDDTITLATDVILMAALPQITSTITIEGQDHTIDGNDGNWSVLQVIGDGNLTLNKVTVTGSTYSNGGAIHNWGGIVTLTSSTVSGNTASSSSACVFGAGIHNKWGIVTLTNSTVSGNTASSSSDYVSGGGIYNDSGTITLTNSTVSGNTAFSSASNKPGMSHGGGIYNDSGTVTLTNSTVSDNTADSYAPDDTYPANSYGGGIYNGGGTVTLTNSTVSGNMAAAAAAGFTYSAWGGGIYSNGTLTLTNTTVSGNTASHFGGGIYSDGTLTLQSSIISGNTAYSGNEVYNNGTVNAASYNLFSHSGETNAQAFASFTPVHGTGGDFVATSDGGGTPTALDAILNTTLADNGGPTQTHALVAGSPVIDLDASCSTKLTIDQRGYGIRPVGAGCDAGAYEYGAVPVFTVTPNASIGGSVAPDTAQAVNEGDTVSFTVTPDAGYTTDEVVSGTCPEGSWAGSTYTTGQIDADCTVEFTFIADKKKINMVPIYKLLLLK